MKRKEPSSVAQASATKRSRARLEVPDYHLSPSVRDEKTSDAIWPAPEAQMKQARDIILECARSQKRTIIVPDKDADGLSSGVILHRTLVLLGLNPELIHVHLLSKGQTVHHEHEREAMAALSPEYIFVLDQGSRKSGPLIAAPHTGLVIDHHHATPEDFPEGSAFCTANQSPPVVTSALLTYLLCEPLHAGVSDRTDWLCVVGTHGDLGTTLKWEDPFPDMSATLKKYTKKALNDVVSYVNAPRRTATYDVSSAFDALLSAEHPKDVLKHSRLLAARQEVNAEVERCTHTAPRFSQDGKVAVFKIKSEAQVHPVIATRWAGHLQSKALEIVMVANEGYLPGKVNFSCRVPRCAKARDPSVDIIQSLKAYASLKPVKDENDNTDGGLPDQHEIPLLERLGDDFARGHVQASGGIVDVDQFEELMRLMRVGDKKEKKQGASPQKGKKPIDAGQSNKLTSYFGKKSA
ncbi:DHH family protein [Aureobasidium pullulans]|uniref:DHH family protein n=1 Tax=Aureobasidium pullulans TaxID=5580 RepID=A0A4S9YCP4_AURPU|nr:DHH family protein [Aureobasidium pullulans]